MGKENTLKLAVAAIVKNELDALPEWLAYHRQVGAGHFLLADNDSSDGTREWLAARAERGDLTLIDVPTRNGEPPQLGAYARLLAACPADVDVIAFIDADEFLLPLSEGDEGREGAEGGEGGEGTDEASTDDSLLPWLHRRFADPEVGAVVMNWACFGSGGARFHDEGLVIERFTRRAKQSFGPNHHYKSIVRREAAGAFINPHHVELRRGHHVDALGRPLEVRRDHQGKPRLGLSQPVVWQGARVNHYIVKSVEEFLAGKSARGSAASRGYVKRRDYFERHDKNDEPCRLAAARVEAVKAQMEREALATSLEPADDTADQNHAQRLQAGTPRDSYSRIRSVIGPSSTSLVRRASQRVREAFAARDDTPILHWVLDYPSVERGDRLEAAGRLIQGWLLLKPEHEAARDDARIVARWMPDVEFAHPLEVRRGDVIKQMFEQPGDDHPQRYCGFRFTVPHRLTHFYLELDLDGRRWPLQEVRCAEPESVPSVLKVLKGKDEWLFLDNDTNASVDQHRGRLRFTSRGLTGWQRYLSDAERLAQARGLPWKLLVAPAKEAVMGPRYHPFTAEGKSPVEQLLALPEAASLVHPATALQGLGDEAYLKTDSHWTHQGARSATLELCVALGLERSGLEALFAKDVYKARSVGGDLGNKLDPPQRCEAKVLASFNNARWLVHDTGLPNFGRWMVFEYPRALEQATCLVFGSSSTYSMFSYLCRVFSRLIFAHSAANIDPALIEAVAPDYLVCQSNGRFLVQVPSANQSLARTIHDKLSCLTEEQAAQVSQKRIVASDEKLAEWGLTAWERPMAESRRLNQQPC